MFSVRGRRGAHIERACSRQWDILPRCQLSSAVTSVEILVASPKSVVLIVRRGVGEGGKVVDHGTA